MAKKPKSKHLGFSPEQVRAAKRAQAQSEQSTPAAIVAAFAPEVVAANGYALERCTCGHIILLTKLGSSLLKTEQAADFGLEDLFKALVLFTRPVAESRVLIQSGRLEAEASAIADEFPPAQIKALGEALNQTLVNAFKTLIPHGSKGESEGSGNFPATAAAPATAG